MAPLFSGLSCRFFPDSNLPFPQIGRSHILGCFSIDTNNEYKNSADCLRYFRMPQKFPLDLNIGYGKEKSKHGATHKNNQLFEFIKHNQDELVPQSDKAGSKGVGDFDFICHCSVLTSLMCTPYENRNEDDWCIRATKYKENIYFVKKEIAQKREKHLNENENQKKAWAYEFKFEQYCMTENPSDEPKTNIPVDEYEKFCCMYINSIEGMKMLYGATVDGVISSTICQNIGSKEVLNSLKMVEVRCPMQPGNKRQQTNQHRYKYMKWWCRNFLVGIEDLMVGFRNDSGLVETIEHMKVSSLPKLSSSIWTPSQCADFLVKFLQMVKKLMKNVNCPHTVYEFYLNPRSKNIDYEIYSEKSSDPILPDWYVSMLQQRSSLESTAAVSSTSV